MTIPPFLIGAALVFWGWQSGNLVAGIALGIVLEAPRYLKFRLDLGAVEHSRIADLSTIGFVALTVLLAANRGISRGILEAFIWAPAALAPVMLAQLLAAAASVLKSDPARLELRAGKVVSQEKSLSFREVMRLYFADTEGEIVGRGFFKVPRNIEVPLGYPSPFWEIGFGAAEVEVDETTGVVKILKYVSLTDAGKMIHPLQCHGQDEGAAVFGLGLTLFEDLIYQDGQLVNPNLVDYRLPRFGDLPGSFRTHVAEEGGGHNFIILRADEAKNYYVQFAASRGETTVRAEAVSNLYLEPAHMLSPRRSKALLALGWNPPTPGQSPNFYRDWEVRDEQTRREMARLAIRTLVEIYGLKPTEAVGLKLHLQRSEAA